MPGRLPSCARLLARAPLALAGLAAFAGAGVAASAAGASASDGAAAKIGAASSASGPVTPIQHVIVIDGEGHTFDNVFGTYEPPAGQSVMNLLSEGIVTSAGQPGANVGVAGQQLAADTGTYSLDPTQSGPYTTLPQPNTTTALGQPQNVPDTRFPANLANAPFQITTYVPYANSYVGEPIHRFYQMWQQVDEGKNDLFVWTANTAGDDNGANPPAPIHQGGLAMGYYNMATGDAPSFDSLAQQYAISDNYHQAFMGGSGPNHLMLAAGDAAFYSDGHGNALVPPASQIENPNAKPGTNNNYTQDGLAGGSYSNCSDPNQPGVGPILSYLQSLAANPNSDCAAGAYYMVNDRSPGYLANGQLNTSPTAVPPQTIPTIADELSSNGVSWGYFAQGYNSGSVTASYCGICNPLQYVTSVMTTSLRNNIHDFSDFGTEVTNGSLPAVSIIQPDELNDGEPASSALSLFETFASNIVSEVQSNTQLWDSTAIFVTFDDGGGYYDSGYIQPTSFFGDGTRVPMIAISPYAKPGYVSHTYADHASILKFIERNWQLSPLSARSLDNLPEPTSAASNTYVPTNGPAIGDLFDMFQFTGPAGAPANPSARIASPSGGATYTLGQKVPTSFSCAEGAGGPGLASCDDSSGTHTTSGGSGRLDTSIPGAHLYTVTATSSDGQTGTASISYTVKPPVPRLRRLRLRPDAFVAATTGPAIVAAVDFGTIISYRDTLAARTKFVVLRCVGKRATCDRLVAVGSFSHRDHKGGNRVHFAGRLHGHALTPGRYLLRTVASLAGQTSRRVTATFQILPPLASCRDPDHDGDCDAPGQL